MNKKYMDFVPVRQGRVETLERKATEKAPEKSLGKVIEKASIAKKAPEKKAEARAAKEVKEAKAKKIKAEPLAPKAKKVVEKHVEKSVENSVEKFDNSKMEIPKYPFINQEKVKKRPLSKNVYRKEIKAPAEEPQGPITIISKPEKDAHASLIITVILTIILGAAAGTVAFLLLPK